MELVTQDRFDILDIDAGARIRTVQDVADLIVIIAELFQGIRAALHVLDGRDEVDDADEVDHRRKIHEGEIERTEGRCRINDEVVILELELYDEVTDERRVKVVRLFEELRIRHHIEGDAAGGEGRQILGGYGVVRMLAHGSLRVCDRLLRRELERTRHVAELQIQIDQTDGMTALCQLRRHIDGDERLSHGVRRAEYSNDRAFAAYHRHHASFGDVGCWLLLVVSYWLLVVWADSTRGSAGSAGSMGSTGVVRRIKMGKRRKIFSFRKTRCSHKMRTPLNL